MQVEKGGLRFLTLNTELCKADTLMPFLAESNFDIVCVQEVTESNLVDILNATGLPHSEWIRMQDLNREEDGFESIGIAIVSRFPLEKVQTTYYSYFAEEAVEKCERGESLPHRLVHSVLVTAECAGVTVATTHLCWTKQGVCTEFQYNAIQQVLLQLEQIEGPVVFCGDLNAPRGNGGYELFSELLDDAVPIVIEGSLDPEVHYSQKYGPVPRFMVDGLFVRGIQIGNFAMHPGISDHVGFSVDLQGAFG